MKKYFIKMNKDRGRTKILNKKKSPKEQIFNREKDKMKKISIGKKKYIKEKKEKENISDWILFIEGNK